MKRSLILSFAALSAVCASPLAPAHSAADMQIGMLERTDPSAPLPNGAVSALRARHAASPTRLPRFVHGPGYFPVWQSEGAGKGLTRLRSNGFPLRRDGAR
jgi:hypothetical protein